MTRKVLTLRISRRALAGVVIADEQLEFFDGRHLRSMREAALRGGRRYVALLLQLTAPQAVVVDCPNNEGSATEVILQDVITLLGEQNLPVSRVSTMDVLQAFGLPGPQSRAELREVVAPFFVGLNDFHRKVRPYVLEAAAAALYAEARTALGGHP